MILPRTGRPLAGVMAALTLALVVPAALGVKTTLLTRDLAEIAELPFFYGVLSNVGVLAWGISAAVCLFAARLVAAPHGARAFLLNGGAFTLVLMVDDLLLVHDVVGPQYLGVSDEWFYVVYGLLFAALIFRHRHFILRRTPYKALIVALILFGSSISIDMHWVPAGIDVEDCLKLYGIAIYAYYFIVTAFGLVTKDQTA
jgi:hypothetical protein